MLKSIRHSKFFIKTFFTYIAILMVPIYIFSSFTYYYSIQKIKTDTMVQCNLDAQNMASVIDNHLSNIQNLSGRVNMLSWVWRLLAETDAFDSDFGPIRKNEVINDLKILLSDNGGISNIIMLFPKKDAAVTLNGWFDIESCFDYLGEDEKLSDLKKNLTKRYHFDVPYPEGAEIQKRQAILLVHSIDNMQIPRAQLIVQIDTARFRQFIQSISAKSLCSLTLYSMDGAPIIKTRGQGNSESRNIISLTLPANALGWKYEMTFDASYDSAAQNQFLFLLVTLLSTLILGPTIAFLLAYVSYKPLKKMINRILPDNSAGTSDKQGLNEYNLLEDVFSRLQKDNSLMASRVKEYSKYAQNDMLVRLLKGYFHQGEYEELSYYGIEYSEKNSFAVLVVNVVESDMKKDDQLQKTMMAGLLVEKILEDEALQYRIIDILEEDIVVILSDCLGPLDNGHLSHLSIKLKNAIADIKGTESFVWSGKIEQGILGISKSYYAAKEAASMSNYTRNNSENEVVRNFYYPTSWEMQLINNLKMGKQESVENILNAVRSENEKRLLEADTQVALCKAINNTISRVAFELNMNLPETETIVEDSWEPSDGSGRAVSKKWFNIYGACQLICARTSCKKQESIDVSSRILDYINQNYTDSNLSLKGIAQEFGLPLSTASKAFKNRAGLNFYDYTCRLRMEMAKDMVKNGKTSVSEICKTVGYENEFSFRRTFLRYEGISFSDYRNATHQATKLSIRSDG